ncbi:trypsin domain-containing protein [Phthorimaea operculella]|nr:trypsin domain-containing protein [Phthorimaea operculella]
MRVVLVLFISVASVLAGPTRYGGQKIIGGEVTTIDLYPYAAAMIYEFFPQTFGLNCGGAILNEKSILSAAHCYSEKTDPSRWRVRVGSSFASSGGQVHNVVLLINHPDYYQSPYQLVHDVAVIHLQTFITFNALVRQALIAGPNYVLETDDPIQSIGWGMTGEGFSEQLKHVQNHVFSREVCQQTYQGLTITDEMLCVGSDNDEGICTGDSGGPNIHNDVVVGVTSFGTPACAQAGKPSVTARVSSYVPWILDNVFKN